MLQVFIIRNKSLNIVRYIEKRIKYILKQNLLSLFYSCYSLSCFFAVFAEAYKYDDTFSHYLRLIVTPYILAKFR